MITKSFWIGEATLLALIHIVSHVVLFFMEIRHILIFHPTKFILIFIFKCREKKNEFKFVKMNDFMIQID
jgi:hypothetical protein